jgi:hypothetical protein
MKAKKKIAVRPETKHNRLLDQETMEALERERPPDSPVTSDHEIFVLFYLGERIPLWLKFSIDELTEAIETFSNATKKNPHYASVLVDLNYAKDQFDKGRAPQ